MSKIKPIYVILAAILILEIGIGIFLIRASHNKQNPTIESLRIETLSDSENLVSRLSSMEPIEVSIGNEQVNISPIDAYSLYCDFSLFNTRYPTQTEDDWESLKAQLNRIANQCFHAKNESVEFAKLLAVNGFGADEYQCSSVIGVYSLVCSAPAQKLVDLANKFKTQETYEYIALPARIDRSGEEYTAIATIYINGDTAHIAFYFGNRAIAAMENESIRAWLLLPGDSTQGVAYFDFDSMTYTPEDFEYYMAQILTKMYE